MMNRIVRGSAPLAMAFALSASVASAAPIKFTLDPAQSIISIDPKAAFGASQLPTSMQGPGSWTTTYSGEIYADVTSSTIQFLPTTKLIAGNSGNWKPGDVFPTSGRAENDPVYLATAVAANYGNTTDYSPAPINGPTASNSAIRGVQLRLADAAAKPLTAGTFSEAGTNPSFLAGTVYYGYGSTLPNGPITNLAGAGVAVNPTTDVAGTGTLTQTGNVMTLTLPINFNTTYSLANVTYYGTVVATAVVPEPTSAVAMLFAAPMLVLARRLRTNS